MVLHAANGTRDARFSPQPSRTTFTFIVPIGTQLREPVSRTYNKVNLQPLYRSDKREAELSFANEGSHRSSTSRNETLRQFAHQLANATSDGSISRQPSRTTFTFIVPIGTQLGEPVSRTYNKVNFKPLYRSGKREAELSFANKGSQPLFQLAE